MSESELSEKQFISKQFKITHKHGDYYNYVGLVPLKDVKYYIIADFVELGLVRESRFPPTFYNEDLHHLTNLTLWLCISKSGNQYFSVYK